jgi:hypothetical protein
MKFLPDVGAGLIAALPVSPSTHQLRLSSASITVILPVGSLCFLVAHQVIEREAVMAGHKVDAVDGNRPACW